MSASRTGLTSEPSTIKVQLEPDHRYVFGINSKRFRNFRARSGESAVPLVWSFTTASTVTLTSETNHSAVDAMRRLLSKEYSYKELRGIDWQRALAIARPELEGAATPREFAERAAKLLASSKDVHLWLEAGGTRVPSYAPHPVTGFDFATVSRLVPGLSVKSPNVYAGTSRTTSAICSLTVGRVMTHWPPRSRHYPRLAMRRASSSTCDRTAEAMRILADDASLAASSASLRSTQERPRGEWPSRPSLQARRVAEPRCPHFGGKVAVLMGAGVVSRLRIKKLSLR